MGLRVRLKASVDISGFGPQARVILQALKTLRDDPRRQRPHLVHHRRDRPQVLRRRPPQPRQISTARTSRSSTPRACATDELLSRRGRGSPDGGHRRPPRERTMRTWQPRARSGCRALPRGVLPDVLPLRRAAAAIALTLARGTSRWPRSRSGSTRAGRAAHASRRAWGRQDAAPVVWWLALAWLLGGRRGTAFGAWRDRTSSGASRSLEQPPRSAAPEAPREPPGAARQEQERAATMAAKSAPRPATEITLEGVVGRALNAPG